MVLKTRWNKTELEKNSTMNKMEKICYNAISGNANTIFRLYLVLAHLSWKLWYDDHLGMLKVIHSKVNVTAAYEFKNFELS